MAVRRTQTIRKESLRRFLFGLRIFAQKARLVSNYFRFFSKYEESMKKIVTSAIPKPRLPCNFSTHLIE